MWRAKRVIDLDHECDHRNSFLSFTHLLYFHTLCYYYYYYYHLQEPEERVSTETNSPMRTLLLNTLVSLDCFDCCVSQPATYMLLFVVITDWFQIFHSRNNWFLNNLTFHFLPLLNPTLLSINNNYYKNNRTRNPLHGQRRTQHQRITILPLHLRNRLARWKARCLWKCQARYGGRQGCWGCWIPIWCYQGPCHGGCQWTAINDIFIDRWILCYLAED